MIGASFARSARSVTPSPAVASAVAHFLARPGPAQNLEAVRVLLEAATTTEGADWHHARREAARLIGSGPREIAIVKNTSEGVAMVATGMDWKSGDRIVAFHEEFPANFLPWKKLEESGVEITWLSVEDPLDKIDDACRGARLLFHRSVNSEPPGPTHLAHRKN